MHLLSQIKLLFTNPTLCHIYLQLFVFTTYTRNKIKHQISIIYLKLIALTVGNNNNNNNNSNNNNIAFQSKADHPVCI